MPSERCAETSAGTEREETACQRGVDIARRLYFVTERRKNRELEAFESARRETVHYIIVYHNVVAADGRERIVSSTNEIRSNSRQISFTAIRCESFELD